MSPHLGTRETTAHTAGLTEEPSPQEGPTKLATTAAPPASPWPSTIESLAKQIADRVWGLVTSRPEQAHLYTGY